MPRRTSIYLSVMLAGLGCNKIKLDRGAQNPKSDANEESASSETEKVSPPNNIAGTYLICAETRTASDLLPESVVNCAFKDTETNTKISLASYKSYLWNYQLPEGSGLIVTTSELPVDPNWHVQFFVKGTSLSSIQDQLGQVLFTLSLQTMDGVETQLGSKIKAQIPTAPTISSITYAVSPDQVTLTWDAVSSVAGYLVVMSSSPVSFTPTDGLSYPTGVQGADTIIYSGASTTATYDTTTKAGTTYYFAIYSYTGERYYSSVPTKSTSTSCAGLAGSWIVVPGNSTYGTSNFCVMKYEAKNVNGVAVSQASDIPWAVTQADAITACSNLGGGIHLITNDQWMTLATDMASVASNWSGGSVGSGALNRGHSDANPGSSCAASANDANAWVEGTCTALSSGTWSQKRTHTLSNGAVIWDAAGNMWDWTNHVIAGNTKPYVSTDGGPVFAFREFTAVNTNLTTLPPRLMRPLRSETSFWIDSWTSAQGIGSYFGGNPNSGGSLRRGTSYFMGTDSGVFAIDLFGDSVEYDNDYGFRCAI